MISSAKRLVLDAFRDMDILTSTIFLAAVCGGAIQGSIIAGWLGLPETIGFLAGIAVGFGAFLLCRMKSKDS